MDCLIIDDDEISRKTIEMCIKRTDFLNLSGSFPQVTDALNFIANNKIDLIFLDIEMPEITGIDFMRNFSIPAQVIVVSAKTEYAAEAFDFNVTDYLVKPIEYPRFLKASMKASTIANNVQVLKHGSDDVFIKKDNKLIKLNSQTILWVEALADYVTINCENNQRHTLLATMKLMEDKLPKNEFVRIHRSYIIRLDKIREIEENSVSVAGKTLTISRGYKDNLFKRLNLL